jgi:hypothetical protein
MEKNVALSFQEVNSQAYHNRRSFKENNFQPVKYKPGTKRYLADQGTRTSSSQQYRFISIGKKAGGKFFYLAVFRNRIREIISLPDRDPLVRGTGCFVTSL